MKYIIAIFVFLIAQGAPNNGEASDFFFEVTTDLRGADEILSSIIDTDAIRPDTSNSKSVDNSRDQVAHYETKKQYNLRPTLRLGYRHERMWSENISIPSTIIISNAYGRAEYPQGATFGGFNFTDPLKLTVTSWDIALEQSVKINLGSDWAFGASIALKFQNVKLKTKFGTWHLTDSFNATRIEGAARVERRIMHFDNTLVQIHAIKGYRNTRLGLSLRHYF